MSTELSAPGSEPSLKEWRKAKRKELISRRMQASAELHRVWSTAIETHAEQLLADVAGKIIAFCWPYQSEFDARALIIRCLGRGARAALPVVVAPRTPMIFREWTPTTVMVAGVYDIPMPLNAAEVHPDITLVPVAGFDDHGYRLGYGGGFFDRTLASLARRPMTIGVGFELSRVPTIFPQWHDIPLDYIVTEVGVHRRDAGGHGLMPLA